MKNNPGLSFRSFFWATLAGSLLGINTASPLVLCGEETAKPELVRMRYNHPGLLDDLAVGLWSWPIPTDFNGDGRIDLIVNTDCAPYNGTYRFENIGMDADHPGAGVVVQSSTPVPNAAMPIFGPGERIGGGAINVEPSYVDGNLRVLRPAKEYPDYAQTGLAHPVDLPLPENIHPNKVRGNMWRYVDFDGDAVLDLAIGIDDWTPYGWADAYTEAGDWKNKPSLGAVYIARNKGTNAKPDYETPFLLTGISGTPLTTYGWPSPNFADFDGDGDLDLFCGEFTDEFTYFENIGSRNAPRYAPGVFVTLEDGSQAKEFLCMPTPLAFDWTGDGKPDLLCGSEDGRISFYENTGTFREERIDVQKLREKTQADETTDRIDGITDDVPDEIHVHAPIFKAPLYFQQVADELKAGSLATPACADFDGDGAIDIVCGTSAGNILFFKNESPAGTEFPKWARPVYLTATSRTSDGSVREETIHIIAGLNGSIQGPIEEKYGYTAVSVADWDGDGLLDVMSNSIWGKPVWFRNIGSLTEPKLAAAEPLAVDWDGEQPRLAWGWMTPQNMEGRTGSVGESIPDLVDPAGKELLTQWRTTPVMFDWNGDGLMDLAILDTEGYLAFFERFRDADGGLKLKSPQRIFADVDGNPLRLTDQTAGGSGRRKICVADWDADGRPDLIVNSVNADFYQNVGNRDGKILFESRGMIGATRLAGHTTSPTTADFNADGLPDLVVGAEDGRFYYLRNPKSDVEP